MLRKFLFALLFLVFSLKVEGASFQAELLRSRAKVLSSLSTKQIVLVDKMASEREIYRMTELLSMPGLGEKAVIKLGGILGYWFSYSPTVQDCAHKQGC